MIIKNDYVYNKKKDWFLVRQNTQTKKELGIIVLGRISFPADYIGKRIKIKIEVQH